MGRIFKIALPAFILGSLFGMAFWYLASPLWIDRVVDEVLVQGSESETIASGAFTGVDALHKGAGEAKLVRMPDGSVQVQFSDFSVSNGPDLKVWLISHADPKDAGDVKASEFISFGPLKGNIGDQAYTLPADADPSAYHSVVIYCKQFSFLFAAAPLG